MKRKQAKSSLLQRSCERELSVIPKGNSGVYISSQVVSLRDKKAGLTSPTPQLLVKHYPGMKIHKHYWILTVFWAKQYHSLRTSFQRTELFTVSILKGAGVETEKVKKRKKEKGKRKKKKRI